jgi:hypothetical protein
MVSRRTKRWPQWREAFDYWKSFDVPPMMFERFVPGKHVPNSPWISRSSGNQMINLTNPQVDTAWHLAKTLRHATPEFVALYKLHASCVFHDITGFEHEVVVPWFKAIGEEVYGWWGRNARNVLSYTDRSDWPYDERGNDPSHWRRIVDYSANEWRSLAEHWAILLVPGLMEEGSIEDLEAEAFFRARQEERDRAEYERLRTRFEGDSQTN